MLHKSGLPKRKNIDKKISISFYFNSGVMVSDKSSVAEGQDIESALLSSDDGKLTMNCFVSFSRFSSMIL